ncbi:MAG: hypothetical protein WCJ07_13845, partial [Verrucomicrobiota bacterium]
MRSLNFITLSITIVTMSAFLALAQPGGGFADRFKQLELNGDGKLTREEAGNARWFDELDRNHDGVLTLEEVTSYQHSAPPEQKPGPAMARDGDVQVYRKEGGGPVPLSDSKAFTDLRFTRDWIPGTPDANGRLMSGTECHYLVAHGGRLYAAICVWNNDAQRGPNPGPSVLVKESANAPWEVDAYFGPRNVLVACLASLTLTTDGSGKALDQPVNLLMAGVSGLENPGEITVFVRDDAKGEWVKSVVAAGPRGRSPEVRHLFTHRDRITGVHRVFAAASSGSVFSGVFDAAAPGRIRWNAEPELSGRAARIMSCGEANGDAYLAVDITPDQPKNGGLFRRVDGPQPRWEWLGEWGHRNQHIGVAWLRALTAIPDTNHPGKELLLCSREVDGVIEVINPQRNHEPHIEFDLRRHFGGVIEAPEGRHLTTIFAYNAMTPAVHPDTGERVHLIGGGLMLFPKRTGDDPRDKSAWFLVRHADGRYGTGQVFDPAVVPSAVGGLRSARTLCVSPFPEDKGRVFYFGGFDAAQGPH